MKITAIETIRIEEFPNLAWLRVATDEGLNGWRHSSRMTLEPPPMRSGADLLEGGRSLACRYRKWV